MVYLSMNKNFKTILLVFAGIIFSVILVSSGYLLATYNYAKKSGNVNEPVQTISPTVEPSAINTTSTPSLITATVTITPTPTIVTNGVWREQRYYDGKGGRLIPGGITGVTGVEIIKNSSNVVGLKLEGIGGLGGTCFCENIYKFRDTSDSFINETVACNKQIGSNPYKIVDLTEAKYDDFTIYTKRARRVGTDFYWTKESTYFNAYCGVNKQIIIAENTSLGFSEGGYINNSYQVTFNKSLSEKDLDSLTDFVSTLN